ncbi:MAG: type II toxin-antitoxin system VapC family toxin [Geminicoccaceae bacterium]
MVGRGAGWCEPIEKCASIWEIAIKAGLGQLRLPTDLGGFLASQLAVSSFQVLPIGLEHAVAVRDLPLHHRDPFDRLLIAQSRTEGLALITRDARMRAYEVDVLW